MFTRFFLSSALLVTLLMTTGCAALVLGGAIGTASVVMDSRSVNTQMDDSGLKLQAMKALEQEESLSKQRIVVVAYNGDILLVGQVLNEELRSLAEKTIRKEVQPLHLFNELRIAHLATLGDRSQDTWITTQVKSKLLADKEQDLTQIKIVTENQEVFLLGLVSKEASDRAAELARHVSKVKKVVRVFNIE